MVKYAGKKKGRLVIIAAWTLQHKDYRKIKKEEGRIVGLRDIWPTFFHSSIFIDKKLGFLLEFWEKMFIFAH